MSKVLCDKFRTDFKNVEMKVYTKPTDNFPLLDFKSNPPVETKNYQLSIDVEYVPQDTSGNAMNQ